MTITRPEAKQLKKVNKINKQNKIEKSDVIKCTFCLQLDKERNVGWLVVLLAGWITSHRQRVKLTGDSIFSPIRSANIPSDQTIASPSQP